MSKAYAITVVEHEGSAHFAAKIEGIYFDRDEAQTALEKAMDAYIDSLKNAGHNCYEEDDLEVWYGEKGRVWTIETVEVKIPLTPLQIIHLNGLAADIAKGDDDYFSYEDTLSDEESDYLIHRLITSYGVQVLPKECVTLMGKKRQKWIEWIDEHND